MVRLAKGFLTDGSGLMYCDKFIFSLYDVALDSRPFFSSPWEIILTAYLDLFFTFISKCMSLCSGFLSLNKLAFAKKKVDDFIYNNIYLYITIYIYI